MTGRHSPREGLACVIAVVTVCGALRARPAAASEAPSRAVVVVEQGALREGLARRIVAELEAMGYAVTTESPVDAKVGSLAALAKQSGAAATIAMIALDDELELRVVDPQGRVVLERDMATAGREATTALLAMQAVEAIRASLLDSDRTAPPAAAAAAVPPARAPTPGHAPSTAARDARTARPASNRAALALHAGPTVVFAPGARAGMDVSVTGEWRGAGRVAPGARIGAAVPVLPLRISAAEGYANVRDVSALAMAFVRVRIAQSPLALDFAAGASLDWLSATGTATPPYVGGRATAFGVSPLAGAGLSARLSTFLEARLSATIGYLLPPTRVRFAGDAVASSAAPLAAIGVALGPVGP